MRSFLYSENLFYFENCLTAFHFGYDLTKCYHANRLGFPKKLFAAIGTHIRKIGFPLHFRFGTKRASIKAAETIKAEFKLLATHLPSLSTTRVDLFFTYKSLCQRFLIYLVRSCQLLSGKKYHRCTCYQPRKGSSWKHHQDPSQRLLALTYCYSAVVSVFRLLSRLGRKEKCNHATTSTTDSNSTLARTILHFPIHSPNGLEGRCRSLPDKSWWCTRKW